MANPDPVSAADGAIPVSPSLDDLIKQTDASAEGLRAPAEYEPVDQRTVVVTALAVLIAAGAGLAAQFLVHLIGFVTNVAFYGRLSTAFVSPGGGHRAPESLLLIPILGGIIVGIMAKYGSAAIRGHGIPEVMEKVLFGESRIPARVLILKPLSAAIAIGTGGPFGAEGPIIATGGALGSLAGQVIRVTADEPNFAMMPTMMPPSIGIRSRLSGARCPPPGDTNAVLSLP